MWRWIIVLGALMVIGFYGFLIYGLRHPAKMPMPTVPPIVDGTDYGPTAVPTVTAPPPPSWDQGPPDVPTPEPQPVPRPVKHRHKRNGYAFHGVNCPEKWLVLPGSTTCQSKRLSYEVDENAWVLTVHPASY